MSYPAASLWRMDRADGITARLAAGHNGMLTRPILRAGGLTDRQIDLQVEAGVLVTMSRGAYRHAAVDLDWRVRLTAAVLAAGEGAVGSHRSAGRLHRLDDVPRWRPEITVPTLDLPIVGGAHVHRTNLLDPLDVTEVDGIPCTALPRTLLDLGGVLPYELVEHIVQVAMIRKQIAPPALLGVLERVGGRGRRGTASLRAIIRHALPDDRIESLLEHLLHELLLEVCRELGIEAPEVQFELVCADGRKVRLDFAWPRRRHAIEADGLRWHGTRRQRERDAARTASIEATAWRRDGLGWTAVHDRPAATKHELRRLLHV